MILHKSPNSFILLLMIATFFLIGCSPDETPKIDDDSSITDTDTGIDKGSVPRMKVADFKLPQQDNNGFTILSPSTGSRIVYVDSKTGNDDKGEVYKATSSEIGSDILKPGASIKPFATIAAANKNMRKGEPDIMLLAADGVWYETLKAVNGKSNTERSIYAAYGTGKRPELRTGTKQAINSGPISNVIISGIKFWAHTRDKESSFFKGYKGSVGFNFYINKNMKTENVLIEDCLFKKYKGNVLTNTEANGLPMKNMAFRRNIFSQNYSIDSHSSGLFYTGAGNTNGATILLEENFFDHHGWLIKAKSGKDNDRSDGQGTLFNHNTYFANAKGVLFKGNIFSRPSSINNKWIAQKGASSSSDVTITDNLYVDGEIGISMGGNKKGALRFKNITIENNVFSNLGTSLPTNRKLCFFMSISDWNNAEVQNNLFIRKDNKDVSNFHIITVYGTEIQNTQIANNIIYGVEGTSYPHKGLIDIKDKGTIKNLEFKNNYIHTSYNKSLIAIKDAKNKNIVFSGNHYKAKQDNWFFDVESKKTFSLDSWKEKYEADAKDFDASIWSDPERDVVGYLKSIGKGSTLNDFFDVMYKQSKSNWDQRLTASKINKWIREGFTKK